MNNQELNKLLQLKKERAAPANDYSSGEQFLAEFHLRLRQRRQRQFTAVLATAASLLLLGSLLFYQRKEKTTDDIAVALHKDVYQTRQNRLTELEQIFGANSGAMFVNDELIFLERPVPVPTKYKVRLKLIRANGEKLAALEFFAAGDDYLLIDAGQVSGSIFLNRCGEHETILELNLSLSKEGRKSVHVAEIFAFDPGEPGRIAVDGLILSVDFSKTPQA